MREWGRYSIRQLVGAPISGKRPAGGVNAESEGIPSLGGENIRADGGMDYGTINRVPVEFFRSMPKGRLQANDVLINKDGAQTGKVGLYDGQFDEAAVNEHVFILRSSSGAIDQRLLYYFLLLPDTQLRIARRITGSAQPGLNSQFADAVHLSVPSERAEQRRIAEILSTVDEAIEQTEALIAKTQQIKAGLMHALFTRGVTEEGQLRPTRQEAPHLYKESPLGWIPKEWEVDIFGSRISVIDPNPSHRYPEEQEVGVPICSTENFRGEDGFDLSKSKLMPLYVLTEQQQRCHFRKNDVVFARKGRIGLARRYGDEPKVFSHTVVIFKAVVASVDQDWLLWLSRSHWFLSDIDRRMNSNSGVPTLGVAFINAVTVPFPPADEQQVINRHLDEISVRESAEVAELQKLRSLKAGLMQDLLSGAVSVAFEHQPGRKEVAAGV
jgi:type I restriction enzyme S subunit